MREKEKKIDYLATATNTITTAAHTDVDCLLDTETAPICKLCKTIGDPCSFEIKPAQPPSHSESGGWTKEEKKTKENEVPNDYYPTSPVYDPTFKQDPLPSLTPKEKLALNPNYYPKGYIPEEKEEAPLLVSNLIDPPERNTSEDCMAKVEETKDKEEEDRRKSIKTLVDDEEDHFDY